MKIAVRGGHNEKIRGSKALLDEVKVDREYYPLVIKHLRDLGHEVLDVTPKSTDTKAQDLSYGVSLANKWGADLFISCHVNAFNGDGYGCEVIHHTSSEGGRVYATRISKSISSIGYKDRGAKVDERGLYELNKTKMTAIIIEPFFLDNIDDVNRYRITGPDALARAITEGIIGKKLTNQVMIAADSKNPIAPNMVDAIKGLQGITGLKKDGIATEELASRLPEFIGGESRGSATILQDILIIKGFLSSGGDQRPPIGPSCKAAISRYKKSVGIDLGSKLTDKQTWIKLLEY